MRMRRRFADRNEGIMNPNLRGPAVDNTAGRRPTEFTQTGEGSWRMNQLRPTGKHIEDYTAGRMRWNPYPEMREHMVGQNKNWLSRIGGALKNEFGGGAMAEGLDMTDLRAQEKFSAEELRNLGLSGSLQGALADEDHRMGIKPPNYPRWQNLWGALPWNRGGIASLRR